MDARALGSIWKTLEISPRLHLDGRQVVRLHVYNARSLSVHALYNFPVPSRYENCLFHLRYRWAQNYSDPFLILYKLVDIPSCSLHAHSMVNAELNVTYRALYIALSSAEIIIVIASKGAKGVADHTHRSLT